MAAMMSRLRSSTAHPAPRGAPLTPGPDQLAGQGTGVGAGVLVGAGVVEGSGLSNGVGLAAGFTTNTFWTTFWILAITAGVRNSGDFGGTKVMFRMWWTSIVVANWARVAASSAANVVVRFFPAIERRSGSLVRTVIGSSWRASASRTTCWRPIRA